MTAKRRRLGARYPRRLFRRPLPALVLAAVRLAGPAAAQPSDGQTFKDWRVRCRKADAAAAPLCHIFQTVVTKEKRDPFLYVAVGLPAQPGGPPIALITLPLGIYLPSGVIFQVDDKQPIGLTVEHCDSDGCHTRLALDDELLPAMKAGLVATVKFRDIAGTPISVPVSLRGFTAGLAALQ